MLIERIILKLSPRALSLLTLPVAICLVVAEFLVLDSPLTPYLGFDFPGFFGNVFAAVIAGAIVFGAAIIVNIYALYRAYQGKKAPQRKLVMALCVLMALLNALLPTITLLYLWPYFFLPAT